VDSYYRGKRVIVAGGLGFIGSNLAIRLVELGGRVTVVDPCVPGCGGAPDNLSEIAGQIRLLECDIGDMGRFRSTLSDAEVIFNLAGDVSHVHSMEFPERDLKINTLAHLKFLQQCSSAAPGVRVVYASTRQVYGAPERLPVSEAHPVAPVDFNGVHKHAAEDYHLMLTRIGWLDAVVLRLSNVYGPRLSVSTPCQGFLGAFFRKLLRGEPIEIYGEGRQVRDPVYVDDVVQAFLAVGSVRRPLSRVYNIGGPSALTIREIARVICESAGAGPPVERLFPQELKAIDIGSYSSDLSLARRELNWWPQIDFSGGVQSTLRYLGAHWTRCVDQARSGVCVLAEVEKAAAAP
jgi:nucleoside-diphosphate-sugar epimerase